MVRATRPKPNPDAVRDPTFRQKPPPEPVDRSKYAAIFRQAQDGLLDGQPIFLDRVRGGGLRTRLEEGRYVGLRGLTYDVESHRTGDGRLDVFITITGREET